MIDFKKLHELQQEYLMLLEADPLNSIAAVTYRSKGISIDESENEIKRLEALIRELKK